MRSFLISVFVLAVVAPRVRAVDITTPGQTVPAGDVGVLQADIQCATTSATGVFLDTRSSLELNGHVIDGCYAGVVLANASSRGRLRLTGPGEIRNGVFCVDFGSTRLEVSDVTVHDCEWGFYGNNSTLQPRSSIRAVNVSATANTVGVQATRAVLRTVDVSANASIGVSTSRVNGENVTANDNGSYGIFSLGKTRVSVLTANDNGYAGVFARSLSLRDSTVTGNNPGGDPGGADLIALRRPRVTNTTCGTSLFASGVTWGVCAGD